MLTYTNELEVKIDLSDVDPSLLENSEKTEKQTISVLNESSSSEDNDEGSIPKNSDVSKLKSISTNSSGSGKASRFFRKTNDTN